MTRSFLRALAKIGWQKMAAKRLPNEEEATEGASVAAANAASLLSDADILAAAGRNATAVSIAVLAFEESVKARTLGAVAAAAAHGRSPGFSDEDLRRIVYSGHQARHAAGFLQHLAATSPSVYGNLMLGMAPPLDAITMLQELAEVVASANDAKQAGFYTDFDPDSGSWSAPATVSGAAFGKIHAIIGDFVTETQRQVDEFRSFRGTADTPV